MRDFSEAVLDGGEFAEIDRVPKLLVAIEFHAREVAILGALEFSQPTQDGSNAAVVGLSKQQPRELLDLRWLATAPRRTTVSQLLLKNISKTGSCKPDSDLTHESDDSCREDIAVLVSSVHGVNETIDGTRKDYLAEMASVPLLILDDLGMRKLPTSAAEDLLELIMRRYERASTLLTSNRPVDDWGRLLGDTAAVTAMLDRLLHHGHLLKCGPRSWRTKKSTDLQKESAPR